METKLAAMLADVGSGWCTVSSVCAELKISRETYYKYRQRFLAEGPPGLIPRSSRPHTSPAATPAAVVAQVLAARLLLEKDGWDNGATSIFYRLQRDGADPPAVRTIHRLLVQAGLVVPQPGKRPRSSYRSFQYPATDDCWQLDSYAYTLADGISVVIFEVKDDRSRYLVGLTAWEAETTLGAWYSLVAAMADYGPPLQLLSDNSLAFTGRLRNIEVLFEKNMHAVGVRTIHSRPHHPQTCGKNERGHQTGQRWLRARPAAATLADLQTLLDEYRQAFNRRPHQALQGKTPLEQRAASTRITPPGQAIPPATIITTPTANSRGAIKTNGITVGLGKEYAHEDLIVFTTGDDLKIYYREYLIHTLTIDPTRSYQASIRNGHGPTPRPRPDTHPAEPPPLPHLSGRSRGQDAAPHGGTILTAASPDIPSPVEATATTPLSARS